MKTDIFTEERVKNLATDDRALSLATLMAVFSEGLELDASGEVEPPEEFMKGIGACIMYEYLMVKDPEGTSNDIRKDPEPVIEMLRNVATGLKKMLKMFSTPEGYDTYTNMLTEKMEELMSLMDE